MKLMTGKKVAEKLGVSPSYVSAVKKAMGVESRWLDLEQVQEWISEHPHFRTAHVWCREAKSAPEKSV